jgi:hypothetical protein
MSNKVDIYTIKGRAGQYLLYGMNIEDGKVTLVKMTKKLEKAGMHKVKKLEMKFADVSPNPLKKFLS